MAENTSIYSDCTNSKLTLDGEFWQKIKLPKSADWFKDPLSLSFDLF